MENQFNTLVIPDQAGILKVITLRFPITPIAIGVGTTIHRSIRLEKMSFILVGIP
jgi:hypothetical protein